MNKQSDFTMITIVQTDRNTWNPGKRISYLWIPSSQTAFRPCGAQAAGQFAAIFVVTAAWHEAKHAAFPLVASTVLKVAIIEADNFIFIFFKKSVFYSDNFVSNFGNI